jgi:hypothetical protein
VEDKAESFEAGSDEFVIAEYDTAAFWVKDAWLPAAAESPSSGSKATS